MAVLALVANKGGVGKTTLAMNIAAVLARRASTVLLDADPQASALQWRNIADESVTLTVMDASVDPAGVIEEVKGQYRYVVVDCPPAVEAFQTHAVLSLADVALIPVQPSPVDLWATVNVKNAIERARNAYRPLRAMLVINQLEARTTLSRLMRETLQELDLPVAETAIRRRAAFRASALEGKSVLDLGRRGTLAAAELEQLTNEVMPL